MDYKSGIALVQYIEMIVACTIPHRLNMIETRFYHFAKVKFGRNLTLDSIDKITQVFSLVFTQLK